MNYYCVITAQDTLKASPEEAESLEATLDDETEPDWCHGFEINYSDKDEHLFIYSSDGNENELPDSFFLALGKLIEKNELPYLEFGVAFTGDRPNIASHGGTSFRIHRDGRLERPQILWEEDRAEQEGKRNP